MVILDSTEITPGLVRFPRGIPGFAWIRAMQLEQLPRGLWLFRSAGPHFVMVPPRNVRHDLILDVDDAVASRLGVHSPADAFALSVVKLDNHFEDAKAHLHSVIVVNRHTRSAMQAVLPNSPHTGWVPLYA
ncbi:MAG TPA: flagellar assembly protein FliW [Acidimicrobiia bacterium]|nr:flagellar assembly protein FliW [Acidimicrobiia bacterium]